MCTRAMCICVHNVCVYNVCVVCICVLQGQAGVYTQALRTEDDLTCLLLLLSLCSFEARSLTYPWLDWKAVNPRDHPASASIEAGLQECLGTAGLSCGC